VNEFFASEINSKFMVGLCAPPAASEEAAEEVEADDGDLWNC